MKREKEMREKLRERNGDRERDDSETERKRKSGRYEASEILAGQTFQDKYCY